jgi:hypothetical protein
VINAYYVLANPYPNQVVAIINQTSQIVDDTGRAVPLSEVRTPASCYGKFVRRDGLFDLRAANSSKVVRHPPARSALLESQEGRDLLIHDSD